MNHSMTVQCSEGELRSVQSRVVETSPSIVQFRTREVGAACSGESQRPEAADVMDGAARFLGGVR